MRKKLSLLLAAAAALAFAVPAFASAATGLTMPEGTLVPTGKIITGTNIGNVTTTSTKLGNITCENVMVEAELVTNTASEVKATKGGTQSATKCFRAGAEEEVFGIELNELRTTGGGTGVASLAYKVKLTGGTVCAFAGTNDTFTYSPGEDVIAISKGALSVTPAACGATAALDGSFTMSTQGTSESVFLM